MMMTIKKDDLKLKKAIDEGRNLLDQLSSFQKEKVDSLVGIKNLRDRVGEVCKFIMGAIYMLTVKFFRHVLDKTNEIFVVKVAKNMRGNRLEETFIVEHACLVETQILQDYTLTGRRPANPLAEILASLERVCTQIILF